MGVQEMAAMGVVLLDTSSFGLRSWYRDRGSLRPIVASTARTKDFFIGVNLIIVYFDKVYNPIWYVDTLKKLMSVFCFHDPQ